MKGNNMAKKYFPKTITAVFIVISLVWFMRDIGYAQRMRMSVDDRVKQLTEQLTLTKVQADSVRKIYEISDKERSKLFESLGANRSAMRDSMQSIMKKYDAKVESLLTVDQREKYDKIKKDRPRIMGPRGDRRRPPE
jgi:Spy/CpxP family protein refolding chaperone